MENFIKSLPKPVLAILAIVVALVFYILNDPPHTVCDVQKDNFRGDLKGQVFSSVTGDKDKHKIPPIIGRAQESCQLGNSAGSCYEYFSILKKIAKGIQNYSSECRGELASISEVQKAMREGVILMAKMAWGSRPPAPGVNRVGWMQESELVLFCQLKDMYTLSFGDEAWTELRIKAFAELPGEPPLGAGANPNMASVTKATETMTEKEIWTRSLFSIRCENYR